jgi:hypothetical protein
MNNYDKIVKRIDEAKDMLWTDSGVGFLDTTKLTIGDLILKKNVRRDCNSIKYIITFRGYKIPYIQGKERELYDKSINKYDSLEKEKIENTMKEL